MMHSPRLLDDLIAERVSSTEPDHVDEGWRAGRTTQRRPGAATAPPWQASPSSASCRWALQTLVLPPWRILDGGGLVAQRMHAADTGCGTVGNLEQ